MFKEKRKNTSLTGSSTVAFILLWCVTYIIGFGALWLLLEHLTVNSFSYSLISQFFRYWDIRSVFLLFGLVLPGLLQTPLVRRFLRGSPRAWISLTLVGLIIAWVIMHITRILILQPGREREISLYLLIPMLFIPVALTQTIGLAQSVKRAWLWPLASILGSLAFFSIFTNMINLWSLALGGLVYGLIMGIVMFYLHINALWHPELSPGIDKGEPEYG